MHQHKRNHGTSVEKLLIDAGNNLKLPEEITRFHDLFMLSKYLFQPGQINYIFVVCLNSEDIFRSLLRIFMKQTIKAHLKFLLAFMFTPR